MSRCKRCNACQNQWRHETCPRCGYPLAERRNLKEIERDEAEFNLAQIELDS